MRRSCSAALIACLSGCYGLEPYACGGDGACNSEGSGVCLAGGCAYPASDCESGMRYSDLAASDVAGACVSPDVDPTSGSTTASTNPDTDTDTDTGPNPTACDAAACGEGSCVVAGESPMCACPAGLHAVPGPACVPDPCQDFRCFYVDSDAADGGDGSTQAPWSSLSEASAGLLNAQQPGDHLMLKRGGRWLESLDLDGLVGSEQAPIVVSAYGDAASGPPSVARVFVVNSTYVTVRDLEVDGAGFEGESGIRAEFADHIIVRDNDVHDVIREGIGMRYATEHTVVLGNRVQRVAAAASGSDANLIFVGDDWWNENSTDVGNHHFIVDNVLVGEPPTQVDSTDRGIVLSNRDGVGDFKVLGNRMTNVRDQGLWFRGNGYAWVQNNDVGGVSEPAAEPPDQGGWEAALILSHGARARVLGNRIFDAGLPIILGAGQGLSVVEVHNNTLSGGGDQWTGWLGLAEGSFRDNLILADPSAVAWTSGGYDRHAELTMTNNAYAASSCAMGLFGEDPVDFAGWQQLGFDEGSSCEPVPGVSGPEAPPDPASWGSLDELTPAAEWTRCERPAGARTCDGEPTVGALEVWPSMPDNAGRGWIGPPIVQARYPFE